MGEDIIGMPAKDFYEIRGNLEAIKNMRSKQVFKNFNMTIRAKKDFNSNSQDEGSGLRYSVIRLSPHSFQATNTNLLQLLGAYEQQATAAF